MKSKILITVALLAILTGCSLRISNDEGFLVLSMSEIVSPERFNLSSAWTRPLTT